MKAKRISRALSTIKNAAHYLPFYHEYNAYLFNRRYQRGLAPWCEISDGLFNLLSKLREEAVALTPEGRIIEIGCGDEALTSRLSKDSREVVGLDISTEAIKRAKEYENNNLMFYVHNLERDPLMGENSLIICEDILYYIPFVSMRKVIKKLNSALVVGGGYYSLLITFRKIWRRGITISYYPNSWLRFELNRLHTNRKMLGS